MHFRMHSVDIKEKSEFLLKKPTEYSHVIFFEKQEGGGLLDVQILINRVTSYFTCQNPTHSEYEDGDLPNIDFSAEAPDWDP